VFVTPSSGSPLLYSLKTYMLFAMLLHRLNIGALVLGSLYLVFL